MHDRQKQQRPSANRGEVRSRHDRQGRGNSPTRTDAQQRIPDDWRERLPAPADYYVQSVTKLTKPNAQGWAQARCPFHDDATASLSVQVTPGSRGGFLCFACGEKGDLVAFHRKRSGLGFTDAVRALLGGGR